MKKRKLILGALCIMLIFTLGACKSKNDTGNFNGDNIVNNQDVENEQNNIELESSNWNILFDENLLGELFINAGNEIKGCDYEVSFKEKNRLNIYINEGNYLEGTYNLNENIIEASLTSFYGEYSPAQNISGKISFKINSNSEIEIVEATDTLSVRTSVIDDNEGWTLTDETKNITLWPLVNGIKYVREENEQTEDVFDVKAILANNNWQCNRLTDLDANDIDLTLAFGSGYLEFQGSLEFNQDGTFIHILPGITTDEIATNGTYIIDGSKLELTYSDGRVNYGTLFITETEPELSLIDHERGYRMYFCIRDV